MLFLSLLYFLVVVLFFFNRTLFIAGVCKPEEDEAPSAEEGPPSLRGVGICKWFNVRMGFGFLSMTAREGVPLEEPVDVFVHQVGRPSDVCKEVSPMLVVKV